VSHSQYVKGVIFKRRVRVNSKKWDPAFPEFTRPAGRFTVVDASSASSAALGGTALEPSFNFLNNFVRASLVPWMSNNALGGSAFAAGNSLVTGLSRSANRAISGLEVLAASQLHGAIDGGYTDDTSIAQAIASGANEVVAFLHNKTNVDPFVNLFSGGKRSIEKGGVPRLFFPIFAEDAAYAQAEVDALARLVLPPNADGRPCLEGIAIGTIKATTAASEWFGIEAGRMVTIKVVAVTSSLGIGFFEDFSDYAALAQEIIGTLILPQNGPEVKGHLVDFLLRSP